MATMKEIEMFHLKWDNKKSCPSFSDIRELKYVKYKRLKNVILFCEET